MHTIGKGQVVYVASHNTINKTLIEGDICPTCEKGKAIISGLIPQEATGLSGDDLRSFMENHVKINAQEIIAHSISYTHITSRHA